MACQSRKNSPTLVRRLRINADARSVCLWCMDNPTLVVRAVAVSPFGTTGWLVQWANKCLNLAVLPHTPQANGTGTNHSMAAERAAP